MSALPALASLYAAEVIVATTATVPVLGEIRLLTTSLLRVEHALVGEQLIQRQQICAVRSQDDTRMSETSMPTAFVEALPETSYPVSIEADGPTWRWSWDPGPVYVGYAPSPNQAGAPASVDDPRVFDSDGDGQPAATVLLSIPLLGDAELYTVHHNHVRMEGLMEGGVVSGRVEILDIAQLTVGASREMFAHSAEVKPVSDQSSFRMWPVQADLDCAALAEGWSPAPHPWLE